MALDLAGQGGALSTAAPDLGLRTNHLWTSTWASVLMVSPALQPPRQAWPQKAILHLNILSSESAR